MSGSEDGGGSKRFEPRDWDPGSAAAFLREDALAAREERAAEPLVEPAVEPKVEPAAQGEAEAERSPRDDHAEAAAEAVAVPLLEDGLDGDFAQLDASRGPDLVDCGRCGAMINPATAAISGDGPICRMCEAKESARDIGATAGVSTGWSPLNYGLLSLVCNPLFIPSILAINGGYTVLVSTDKEQARADRMVRGQRTEAWMAILFGMVHPLMMLGGLALVLLGAVVAAATEPDYDDYSAYDPYDPYAPPAYDDPYDPYAGGGLDDQPSIDDILREAEANDPNWGNEPIEDNPAEQEVTLDELMRRAGESDGVVETTHNYTARIERSTGATTFAGPCEVSVDTLVGDPMHNCAIVVSCGGNIVYSGNNLCQLVDGQVETARDVGRTVIDGTPALTLDMTQRTARVSDADFNLTLALE